MAQHDVFHKQTVDGNDSIRQTSMRLFGEENGDSKQNILLQMLSNYSNLQTDNVAPLDASVPVENVSIPQVLTTLSSIANHSLAAGDVTDFGTGRRNYSSYEELELLSTNWQVFLVILYSLTAAIALIGNVISIWVITTGKRSSKELRIFLVNLSLSDIIMACFSIPFTYTDFMLGRWIFLPAFCPIVQFMQITSVVVSVYTLTAIGIDRYMAIIHPLLSNQYNRKFGLVTILIIWLCGITIGFVQWANTRAAPFYIANDKNYKCEEKWSQEESRAYTISLLVITFALPMTILSYAYGSVALKIFRHSTPGNPDAVRDKAQQLSKIKIIKMLATIVVLFAVCWLPLHVFNLFIHFGRDFLMAFYKSRLGFNIYVTIAITAHWLSMANSFVNPIIYCFMSENFRADLRLLFQKCLVRCPLYRRMLVRKRRGLAIRTLDSCHSSTISVTLKNSPSINKKLCSRSYVAHNNQELKHSHQCEISSTDDKPKRSTSLLRGVQIKLWIKKPDPQFTEMCLVSVQDDRKMAQSTVTTTAAATTAQYRGKSTKQTAVSNCHSTNKQSQGNGRIEHSCATPRRTSEDGDVRMMHTGTDASDSEHKHETCLGSTLCPLMKPNCSDT